MKTLSTFPLVASLSLAASLFLCVPGRAASGDAPHPAGALGRRVRQPVALAVGSEGKVLLAANRKSGSLSVIDIATSKVVAEFDVGRGLADIALLEGGRYLLAVDEPSNEVLLIDERDGSMRVVEKIKVSPGPLRVAVSPDGRSAVVSSLWSRQLSFISLARRPSAGERPALATAATLDLPFCPRELAFFPEGSRVVVADAFGGRLAVVDARRQVIEAVRPLPAHNIRGLAFSPDGQRLAIAHQVLNRLAQTSFDDVHWGLVIRNHLRVLPTAALFSAQSDSAFLGASRLFDLGDVGYAAGDPGNIAFDARGNLLVALAGVDEVAITASPDQGPRRIVVGRRPTAVAPFPLGDVAYVANSLDDTISVVKIATGQNLATISLGPRPEPTAVDRGERLFSSAKLSHDGWMSCHSCHTDGHTNNLSSDTLGDGSYGAAKRVPSLLGVAATGPWTWTGGVVNLEEQIRKSIATTMHGPKPTGEQVTDLTAYLSSLAPPSPELWQAGAVESAAVARGRAVFEARKCASCHAPPEYTSQERYDVGLSDEVGNHEFNPPSLRAVSRRDTFLHDGRARSLEQIFSELHHPRGLELTSRETVDLIVFLKTL